MRGIFAGKACFSIIDVTERLQDPGIPRIHRLRRLESRARQFELFQSERVGAKMDRRATTQYVGEAQHCDTVALLSDGQLIALDHPDRLVRRALGGDLLEVVTKRPIDPRPVRDLRGIQRVEQRSPERLRIVAEDGSAATPLIVDTITAHGGEVATINERRPTLDEVFALLVEDHRARNGDPEPAAP